MAWWNIFLHEVRAHVRSLAVWSAVMAVLIWIATSKFQGYWNNPEARKLLESMPPALLKALGMDVFDITTLKGFFAAMAVYYGLLGAMAAGMWGSGILAKEEREKTADFLLSLPLPRSAAVFGKVLAVLVMDALFVLLTWAMSMLAALPYSPTEDVYRFLALEIGAMFLIEVVFSALGMLVAAGLRDARRAGAVTLSLILILYFLALIQPLHESLEPLKYVTPFKYYDVAYIVQNGHYDPRFVTLSLVIVLVALVGAFLLYRRRDIALA